MDMGSVRRRAIHAVVLLGAAFLGVLWTLDVLAGDAERALTPAGTGVVRPLHASPRRVLALVVDSLPHRVAVDPRRMPHLASMRSRATYSETRTTRDAITVSALRAAFTGRERLSPFEIVRNLRHADEEVESLFSQARAEGLRVLVVSDGSFDQFGPRAFDLRSTSTTEEPEADFQDRAAGQALSDFVAGRHDFTVVHVTYGDHAAHRLGEGAPEYTVIFQRIDRLVEAFDRATAPGDTLVVMGDHGHDAEGRHGPGIDEPTFSLYRGPAFAAGRDLGGMPLTEHRALLSLALGLPAPLPSGRQAPEERGHLALVAAHVGVFAWLWLRLLRARGVRPATVIATWALVALLWVPFARPWSSLAALSIGALSIALSSKRPRARALLRTTWAPVAAVALALWGYALSLARPRIAELGTTGFGGVAACAAVTGTLAAVGWGPVHTGWVLLASTALFLYPEVGPFGAVVVVPLVWAVFLVVLLHASASRTGALRRVATPAVGALALLLPFLRSSADHGRFVAFEGPLAPDSPSRWLALAAIAKAVIFLVPASGTGGLVGGAACVILLTAVEGDLLPLHGRVGSIALVAAIATALLLHVHRRRSPFFGELSRVARLGLLFAAVLHLVRVPLESRAWADCLFAALVLSGVAARRSSDLRVRRGAPVFLLAVGVIASGFGTLSWTTHRLEWSFLYDWFPGDVVERRAPLFIPLLVGRYVLPVLIVRHLLTDVFHSPPPVRDGLALDGIKVLALSLSAIGIALHAPVSDAFVFVVEQQILFFFLSLGLIPAAHRRLVIPGPAPPSP